VLAAVRQLSKHSAIYGVGDVAIQALNFLLLPVYVRYLSASDYGVIALLAAIEAPVKLFFRWGIDGAFMRYWYDCKDEEDRQRLSSTIFFFLLGLNGVLLVLALAAAPVLAPRVLGVGGYTLALQLVLLNTFAIGFTFIPFHVLRIQNRATEFSALTVARSASTLVLRLVFVVGLGYGVMGVVVADVAVTAVLLVVMVRWFAPLIRPVFSREVLARALSFGLPRVPHGLALQVMAVADKFLLERFRGLAEVGTYTIGVSFGLIPKMALAAFEYAWAPFYYATAREPGAGRVFSAVTTYAVAALALMTAGLAAIATDLLHLMTGGRFVAASGVVTWIAIGVFFYGVYLLTSIGLNITSRTRYYPVSTAVGAGVNITLNLLLIPRFGMIGAAWANAAGYGVQAAVALHFSQRFYPIRYESGRITRAVLAAGAGFGAAQFVPDLPAHLAIAARGGTVLGVMLAVLWMTRFFNAEELRWLDTLRRRRQDTAAVTPAAEASGMAGEIVAVEVPDEVAARPDLTPPPAVGYNKPDSN
jgi:O-antigen/teichoic acid export membrane protein